MPGDFRRDRGGLARVFYFFTHEAAGALGTRHSPRPLRADEATTRTRLSPRERGGVWFSSRAKFTLSFRGARKGEPGIHFSKRIAVRWIPGSRSRAPRNDQKRSAATPLPSCQNLPLDRSPPLR